MQGLMPKHELRLGQREAGDIVRIEVERARVGSDGRAATRARLDETKVHQE